MSVRLGCALQLNGMNRAEDADTWREMLAARVIEVYDGLD
jgi:hypothetical protein